ncbi:MAG TPA: DUF2029 domain-containing protein [bacterium]|nr:DUF2029 domain-containing protein [bacterium]
MHTKALPILLLGYLLVRGRWRAIAWTAAFGVALALLPVLFWGGETLGIYSAYLDQLQTKIHTGTIGDGAITIASRGDREYFTLRGLVATLVPSTASSVVVKYACLVAVLAGAFVWHVRRRHRRDVAAAAAAFSIWLLAALLISPISEKHHLALAFPAVGLLAVHAARAVADRVAWFLLAGVSGCVLLAKPWPSGPWYLLMIGFALFGAWRATVGDVR